MERLFDWIPGPAPDPDPGFAGMTNAPEHCVRRTGRIGEVLTSYLYGVILARSATPTGFPSWILENFGFRPRHFSSAIHSSVQMKVFRS